MRAGRLSSTITIERRGPATKNGKGAKAPVWVPVLSIRAEILSSDARAFLAEPGETVERGIVFRVRFRDGIEPGDRVTCGGVEYQLAEIKEVVRRRVLELRCTGGAS